jgi:hypothetical protein
MLVEEANLSFLLNTQLFSLIRAPSSASKSATAPTSASPSSTLTQRHTSTQIAHHQPAQELRYYEKRELEQAKIKLLNTNKPVAVQNTWWESGERFITFVASVGLSMGLLWGVQNVVIPEMKARGIIA